MDTAEGDIIIDDVMTPTSNLFYHYIINISIAYIHHVMSYLFQQEFCVLSHEDTFIIGSGRSPRSSQ